LLGGYIDVLVTDHETAEKTLRQIEELLGRRTELDNRLSILNKEIQVLEPWGDFEPSDLEFLSEKGVFVQLFELTAAELTSLDLSKFNWHSTSINGKQARLAVLALDEAPVLDLERTQLPARSLSTLTAEQASFKKEIADGTSKIGELSAYLPALYRYEKHLQDRIHFAEVKSGLGGDEELFALSGWCPADKLDDLHQACANLPVAAIASEPDQNEDVPIALKNGPLVRQFQPLLAAFNLPNYLEWDPTLFLAPFMGIFFGFCLGDMGYGLVLTAIGLLCMVKFDLKGDAKLAVQWLVILGICTMVVGGLLGNFFGEKAHDYETLAALEPLLLLSQLNKDPGTFFAASLLFGVVQLTFGMLIKLARNIQLARWQHVIGSLGWLSVFPTLGVWYQFGTPWAFVGTVVVLLLFASPSPNVVHRIGGGAWALYNITGLLGDVMSYARIFGLGLSSGIIAMVINIIAMTIVEGMGPAGWLVAVPVLVGGHTFNFAMATIGAVVHPARLQFLEFFGKFYEGGGRAYAPFQKLEGE
ncbi:MAG: hypothetical protein HN348_08465, partial [Proteobacteria bacterium]|nr:hypothetical protein [Pseudomonadota bacterium]